MIRLLSYLALLAIAMVGMAWLGSQTGEVTIVWAGWRIDMHSGALAGLVLLAMVFAALVYRFWRALVTGPRRFARWRRERRTRRGYAALSAGLVAVAAGDPAGARRLAGRAERLLDDKALTLLLSAQAAQLSGDEHAAQTLFAAMAERPDTEFLGLRGLLARAVRDGDTPRALELARRARALRPETPWVLSTLLTLQTRAGDWEGAVDALDSARTAKVLPSATRQRHQAAAYLELSRAAARSGSDSDAWRYAKRAHGADPGHAIAAAWLAERMAAAGKFRRAARLVEQEWVRRPHPALLAAYRQARRPETALAWVKDAERLAGLAPAHRESRRAVGEATLAAGLWGEARKHLSAALAEDAAPSASLCRELAKVEESDTGDLQRARRWLDLAAEGNPDPGWICDACGAVHNDWRAVCRRCGSFDTLSWRLPDQVAPTLAAAVLQPPPLGELAPPPS